MPIMAVAVPIILFTFLLAAIAYPLIKYLRLWFVVNRMPGPAAIPFIGNAHQFERDGRGFFKQILKWVVDYEDSRFMRLWLGPVPIVLVYRADAAEIIFNSSKHITKAFVYDFLHPWLGTGLLTSTGDKWKSRRRLLTPTFHFKILNHFVEVFNDQAVVLVKNLNSRVGKDEFNIFPLITHCVLDIICETAMGIEVKAQSNCDSEYVRAVIGISELVQDRMKTPWYWPETMYNITESGKKHEKYLKILHGMTNKVIRERSAELRNQLAERGEQVSEDMEMANIGGRKRLAFLDMLLYMNEADPSFTYSDIREEVDTFLFEGHDTTAAGVTWATYLIASHPEVQEKLQAEMDTIFGDSDRSATIDDLKAMKYLDCVIKESLRLFPSVPIFARKLDEDVKIAGYDVPKETAMLVAPYALHRDPKYFPDPEVFDPDRFSLKNASGRHPYAYVPFSAGLRNCIGQKFAMFEEKVVLSSILRNFTMETTQTRDELEPVGELILRPQDGIRVKVTSRNNNQS
ncbi:cytochrome P450 4V2-like [Ptychodera flava]|uniref:cytochrome P450 4V2-like n=1 Tax=Ptychodera flava TaxID=63121 RepID=UPI00396A9D5B